MRQIKNIEKITSVYSAWKATDVAFIKSLEWSMENLVIVFYCQVRGNVNGWPDTSKDFFEVTMTFKCVRNLTLKFSSNRLQQVSGFDILDVSDSQLGKIGFEIEDYENGIIGFACEDIEINSLSKPDKLPFA